MHPGVINTHTHISRHPNEKIIARKCVEHKHTHTISNTGAPMHRTNINHTILGVVNIIVALASEEKCKYAEYQRLGSSVDEGALIALLSALGSSS